MLTALQRRKLQLRFALLDTDGNGYLSQRDYDLVTLRLCAAFGHLPGTEAYERVHNAYLQLWERLRSLMDVDGEGRISLSQFMNGCAKLIQEQRSAAVQDPVDLIFDMVDADQNGVIDLAEFTKWMRAGHRRGLRPARRGRRRGAQPPGGGRRGAGLLRVHRSGRRRQLAVRSALIGPALIRPSGRDPERLRWGRVTVDEGHGQ